MNTDTFLFELGCEELPPKALPKIAEAFKNHIQNDLDQAKLKYKNIDLFYAPRRIAIKINQLDIAQADQIIEKRGPTWSVAFDQNNNPTPALNGFLKGAQAELSDIEPLETPKGKWVMVKQNQKGLSTQLILSQAIQSGLKNLPIPKLMRWGNEKFQFVRPVHWLVLMQGSEIIPANILGLDSNQFTFGHRFHHPKSIKISDANNYPDILEQTGYVIADPIKRKNTIKTQIDKLIQTQSRLDNTNYTPILDSDLLEEVSNIVEWPESLLCQFNKNFLSLPKSALISSMQGHQKCFPVLQSNQNLAPFFITVSNIQSKDPKQVIKGNEKVMQARLSDAAFFFESDQNKPLESNIPKLSTIIFQTKLGTLKDKIERIHLFTQKLAKQFKLSSTIIQNLTRAVSLSKCDLMTDMVMEFPELQGVMGECYAEIQGEPKSVSKALFSYYQPRFAQDDLPNDLIGWMISLSDKLDTLVGIFGVGLKPTGTKDPFALRRASIGILRLLNHINYFKLELNINLGLDLDLNLEKLIKDAISVYPESIYLDSKTQSDVLNFMLERIKYFYKSSYSHNFILSILKYAQNNQKYNLLDLDLRLKAIDKFKNNSHIQDLSAAHKRISQILAKSKEKEKNNINLDLDINLFKDPRENELYQTIQTLQPEIDFLLNHPSEDNYLTILEKLATLKHPIDDFFDHVQIMADEENIKNNRLNLLKSLNNLLESVVSIGEI